MAGDRYGKNVVLLADSEFGRRVAANASQGSDHGTAGPVFVAGTQVNGGFYGEESSLIDLDNCDLKLTTYFRDVYYECCPKRLGPTPRRRSGQSGRASAPVTSRNAGWQNTQKLFSEKSEILSCVSDTVRAGIGAVRKGVRHAGITSSLCNRWYRDRWSQPDRRHPNGATAT